MFGNNGPELGITKECRPDLEVMLQDARSRRENVMDAIDALRKIAATGLYISGIKDDEPLKLVGALVVEVWRLEARIQSLLDEMNKG